MLKQESFSFWLNIHSGLGKLTPYEKLKYFRLSNRKRDLHDKQEALQDERKFKQDISNSQKESYCS